MPFGGLLGSTFGFVFETQLEALQNGDRFYYLARTAGLDFLIELENNSFAKLIMVNTDATHLPADVFSTPAFTLEVDHDEAVQCQRSAMAVLDDGADPEGGTELLPARDPRRPADAAPRHELSALHGRGPCRSRRHRSGDDIIIASIGDDTLWGDGGNDRLEGGAGNDNVEGGAGDDIITDLGGDDIIQGDEGNDVIQAATAST